MELRKNSGPLKWTLIAVSALFLSVMLLLPLIYIVVTALRQGFAAYAAAVTDSYAPSAGMKGRYRNYYKLPTILKSCCIWKKPMIQYS